MVKLNFKTAKPLQPTDMDEEGTKKPRSMEPSSGEPEEAELQYVEESEEQIEIITESESEEVFETLTEEEPAKPSAQPSRFKFKDNVIDNLDDDSSGSSGGGKKVLFIILAIVIIFIVLGAGGYAIYNYTDIFKGSSGITKKSPPVASEPSEPVSETQERPETTAPPTSPMLSQWQQNLGNNYFIYNHLQKIVNNKSEYSRFSLIVFTPDEVNLTILSDATDKIARFKDQLNQTFPNLNFRTISTTAKTINRSRLTFADIRSNIPSKLISPANTLVQKGAPSENFSSDVSRVAQQQGVSLNQINSGKTITYKSHQAKYFYLTISGSSTGILNFLQKMITDFPALQINKIALNPTNLVTYSDKNLSARINLLFIYPI